MFERFTNQSRRVVVLAQEEARGLNHNYIGTEHLLLGLLHEGRGSAARVLEATGVTLDAVREQVVSIIGRGQQQASGHIPFTPRAKKSLELSLREALRLGDGFIGTGHLLLGMIRQGDNTAIKILGQFGADLKELGTRVTQDLRDPPGEGQDVTPAERERRQVRVLMRDEVQGLLDKIEDQLNAIERHLGITRRVSAAPRSLDEQAAAAGAGAEAGAEPAGGAGESDELLRERARVARLEALLREAGIDPDGPQEPPAAAG